MFHKSSALRGAKKRQQQRKLNVESLEPRIVLDGQPIITEFLASNSESLLDGDGNSSDWIELYNAGDAEVDLAGWYLSDDVDDLTMWPFPNSNSSLLGAGEYLVVFASGQLVDDYIDGTGNLHTNFGLNADGDYLALVQDDGTTVVSQFSSDGTDYPQQYQDISYGIGQDVQVTTLVEEGDTALVLVPDAADDTAIGSTWTGGNEVFDDSTWQSTTTGVGFDSNVVIPPVVPTQSEAYSQSVLDDNPIGYWKLGEAPAATTAADASASGNDLSYNGFSAGDFAQQGIFPDGSDDAIALSDAKPDDVVASSNSTDYGFAAGQSFSVEYWIKADPGNSSVNGAGIITKGYDSTQVQPWYLSRYSTTGKVDFLLRASSGNDFFATSTSSVDDGNWHQIVGVYDSVAAESRIYVDGALEDTVSGVIAAAYGTNSGPLTIGNHVNRTLDASLDEIAIYDSALSNAQILDHFNTATADLDPGPDPTPGDSLKIDFTRSPGGGLQTDYEEFAHDGISAVTKSYTSSLGLGQSVDVTLEGNTHWRNYAAATGDFADQSALLSDGPLCNLNCTMTLTFDNLVDGTYQITTYHHTTQFGPSERPGGTPFDIVLTDGLVSDSTIASEVEMSDNSSSELSAETFEFTVVGGSSIEIDFVRGFSNGTDDHFALPGFDLTTLTLPSVGDLVTTDITNLMFEENASAYLRIPFDVDADASFDFLTLSMQYDDGFVAYLNGTEVARHFAPGTAGTPPAFDAQATTENVSEEPAISEDINLTAFTNLLIPGQTNILAFHGLNINQNDTDFLILPQLVATSIQNNQVKYFEPPTPGGPNESGFTDFVSDTTFSVDRGIFDTAADAFDVEITTDTTGASIVYTIDGSEPTVDETGTITNGIAYSAAINIAQTTTLRAMAFKDGFRSTNVDTQTYLFLDDVLDQNSTPPTGYPATWGGTFTDWGLDQNEADLKAIAGDSNITIEEAEQIIKDSLQSLPTLSLVMDIDDVFGASNGIYSNTQGRGDAWERATSVELIDPNDPTANFQVNSGIRIQGFTSRDPNRNPKHSLRLIFRNEYGAGKLNYPFFGEDAADEFNTIVLRSNSQDAWVYDSSGNRQGQFVRDQWARDTLLALDRENAHGNWVHLYINGLYWGVYNPTERPDDNFNESYFAGDAEDFDVLKNHEEVIDGNNDAYFQLLSLIQNDPNNFGAGYQDFTTAAAYQEVQGKNPDGTDNPALPNYLNVPNLIDYMIVNMYAAATDWPGNNYISRDRTDDSEGFHFFAWDNEHGMKPGVSTNRTAPHSRDNDSPTKFHHALRTNEEYKMLFADHLHNVFFNGGVLYVDPANPEWDPAHPERNMPAARWMELTGEIEEALIAEAARWGDVRGTQYTPHDQFQDLRNSLLANWFPQRSSIVLGQFQTQGLYPPLAAPSFNQHGGDVIQNFGLEISAPSGLIYYTLDGTDPRDLGAVSGTAIPYTPGSTIPLSSSATVKSRTYDGSNWSALNKALFTVNVPLRVSEIMFNPDGSDSTEYIELVNTSGNSIPLAGVRFDGSQEGIEFTFDNSEVNLPAGERIVIVRDQAAFAVEYADEISGGIRVASGQYADTNSALANGGEEITLLDAAGGLIQQFTYSDDWYKETDGDGFSLIAKSTTGDYNDPLNWRSSAMLDGSPGTADLDALKADFNGDGIVDSIDLARLLEKYGDSSGNNRFDGDANGDGAVSLQDLLILKKTFGEVVSSPPAAAAAALTISVENINHPVTNRQDAVVDQVILNEFHDWNPIDQSEEDGEALPIRRVESQRATVLIDQTHEINLSLPDSHLRRTSLLRARRGTQRQDFKLTQSDQT